MTSKIIVNNFLSIIKNEGYEYYEYIDEPDYFVNLHFKYIIFDKLMKTTNSRIQNIHFKIMMYTIVKFTIINSINHKCFINFSEVRVIFLTK